jgi:transcription elongation factor GreB
MARALLRAREGDSVTVRTPGGIEELDVVAIRYVALDTDPARG